MANSNSGPKGPTPAYVSTVTFRNFLKSLTPSQIPPRIDTSVMSSMSGATQSEMATALRFFGLINDDGEVVGDGLLRLVASSKSDPEWSQAAKDILLPKYETIIRDLDISRATAQQLDEHFGKYGAQGSVRVKAVRFYLKVLEDAGVSASPHFKKTRKTQTTTSRRTRRSRPSSPPANDPAGHDSPKGMISIPLYFKGRTTGQLTVPSDFGKADQDVNVVDAAVAMAKVYAMQEGAVP